MYKIVSEIKGLDFDHIYLENALDFDQVEVIKDPYTEYIVFIDKDTVITSLEIEKLVSVAKMYRLNIAVPSVFASQSVYESQKKQSDCVFHLTKTALDKCIVVHTDIIKALNGYIKNGLSQWQTLFDNSLEIAVIDSVEICFAKNPEKVEDNSSVYYKMPLKPLVSFPVLWHEGDKHYLKECLDSLPSYAEKVIVETVKVEGSNNEVVYVDTDYWSMTTKAVFHWDGKSFPFDKARNAAKELCKGQWIFSIDADERFPQCQHNILKDILKATPYNVMALLSRNYSWIKDLKDKDGLSSATFSIQCRLFRNLEGIEWRAKVHENVQMSIDDLGGDVVDSPLLLIHEGYDIPAKEQIEKTKRNIEGMLELDRDILAHPYYQDKFGKEYMKLKAWELELKGN